MLLRTLDATCWSRLDASVCKRLGRIVVAKLGSRLDRIIMECGDATLAQEGTSLSLAELDLELRTYNCLRKAFRAMTGTALCQMRLSDVIAIPTFGVKSLVDLLTSIEASQARLGAAAGLVSRGANELRKRGRAVQRLLDLEKHSPEIDSTRDSSLDSARALLGEMERSYPFTATMLDTYVPEIPCGVTIEDLELSNRTHKVLVRAGLAWDLDVLRRVTIRQLCELRGFGRVSVLDLVRNVCRVRERSAFNDSGPLPTASGEAVNDVLGRISTVPGGATITASDPRIGARLRAIGVGVGAIADLHERCDYFSKPAHLEALAAICKEIEACASLPVESEAVNIIVGKRAAARNRSLVSEYYGFYGQPKKTLQELGVQYDVSRERIRQICAPTRIGRLKSPPFAPALDSALEFIHRAMPSPCPSVEAQLSRRGLICEGTTIAAVARIAQFLGREPKFTCVGIGGMAFALSFNQRRMVERIERVARKLVKESGAASMVELMECSPGLTSYAPETGKLLVSIAVDVMSDFQWLERSGGWFGFEGGRYSVLRRRIRKVLAVCGQIRVADLRRSIRRDYRLRGRVPPTRILREICLRMAGTKVEGDAVVAATPDDPVRLCRGDEAIMVKLLLAHGPICRLEHLQSLAAAEGVSRSSFWRCLQFCPTIARYGPCVYGLPGAAVAPGAVDSLAGVRRPTQVIKDHGWTPDGNVWIAYRVSQGAIDSGVVGVPAAKMDLLQGRFALNVGRMGDRSAQLAVKRSSAWGIGPYLRRNRAEQGDYLLLVFDLKGRIATAFIGDETMLGSYQDCAGPPGNVGSAGGH